jgi:hypothetical protein
MASKGVTVKDVYESFEANDLEKGLYLLNKPETEITIVRRSDSELSIENGDSVEMFCVAECFPKPRYTMLKDGRFLCYENTWRISNAR